MNDREPYTEYGGLSTPELALRIGIYGLATIVIGLGAWYLLTLSVVITLLSGQQGILIAIFITFLGGKLIELIGGQIIKWSNLFFQSAKEPIDLPQESTRGRKLLLLFSFILMLLSFFGYLFLDMRYQFSLIEQLMDTQVTNVTKLRSILIEFVLIATAITGFGFFLLFGSLILPYLKSSWSKIKLLYDQYVSSYLEDEN